MSIQNIIDGSTNITISRPAMTSQQVTRSGRLVSSSVNFSRPWRFNVTYNPGQRYTNSRSMVETLDYLDRRYTEDVDIGDTNTNLSYITEYQGDYANIMNTATLTNVNNYSDTITINVTSGSGSGGYLLKKGDFIQPGKTQGYPYTYTVVNDVPVPVSSGNVSVLVHRNFIPHDYPNTATFIGQSISYGTNVRFRVQMVSKPDHSIVGDQLFNSTGVYVLQEVIE